MVALVPLLRLQAAAVDGHPDTDMLVTWPDVVPQSVKTKHSMLLIVAIANTKVITILFIFMLKNCDLNQNYYYY